LQYEKKWTDVFQDEEVKRVIMDNDSYTYNVTTRKVIDILIQNNPVTVGKKLSLWERLEKHKTLVQNSVIYTDGSWKDDRNTTEKLFRIDRKKSISSAAVVIVSNKENWKMGEIITLRIVADTINVKEQISNAFTMETIAILAAAQISKWAETEMDITTDCKAVMDKLNYAYMDSWAHHGQAQLLKAITLIYKKKIKWTRSHPELRKNVNQYDKNDFGIAMADSVCNGDLLADTSNMHTKEIVKELNSRNIHHYDIKLEEVLKEILKILPYAWTKEKIPLIVTLQSIKDNERRKEYIEKRDQWNVDNEGEVTNIWKNTTLEHGGTICRAKGVKNKVLATKILYDWVEHGRNRAKRKNDNNDKDVAKTCRECGEIDSQFHIITECLTKNLTSIRIETDARIDLYIKGVEEKRGEYLFP
jgi:ribonuclease HI